MRREFSKVTKRQVLTRSLGKCEAYDVLYGLKPGQRCDAPLSHGVEFDHVDLEANSKDNSFSNCAAVCPKCHRWKSSKHDIPLAAKTLRQQDKARGIKRSSWPMPGSRKSKWKKRLSGEVVERK